MASGPLTAVEEDDVATTDAVTIADDATLGDDVSFDLLLEKAQRAQDRRREFSELLVEVITQDSDLLQHLEAVITGTVKSPWAGSKGMVPIFFEEDEQLDRVLRFLTDLVKEPPFPQRVNLVMDVLLPEATVHALTAVHAVTLDEAINICKRGVQFY